MGYSLKMTRSSIAPLTVYLMSLRPKQWVKNLLVIAAPIAAGQFFTNLFQLFLGCLSFIFASSLGYLVNDWRDRKSDQVHPLKRNRPFASGELSFKHFLFLSFFLPYSHNSTIIFSTILFYVGAFDLSANHHLILFLY